MESQLWYSSYEWRLWSIMHSSLHFWECALYWQSQLTIRCTSPSTQDSRQALFLKLPSVGHDNCFIMSHNHLQTCLYPALSRIPHLGKEERLGWRWSVSFAIGVVSMVVVAVIAPGWVNYEANRYHAGNVVGNVGENGSFPSWMNRVLSFRWSMFQAGGSA